jgi:hypothetical protein
MHFRALLNNQPRDVIVQFGTEQDVRSISRWRTPNGSPIVLRDAVEFARLASKRWKYYRRYDQCSTSLDAFRKEARPSNSNEIAMILLARAQWFSSKTPIGLALCRKSYCNHLILDFLSVHPKAISHSQGAIRGIGSGLLYTLAALARNCHIPLIWGEATISSAPFYAKTFSLSKLKDLFVLAEAELQIGLTEFQNINGVLEST